MKWILIALLIVSPVTIWIIGKWLENFAYRTGFGWWIMVVAGLIAVAIGLIAVSGVTWLAVRKNPAKSLRYE